MRQLQPRLVSGVSPFRLFGHPQEPEPVLERDDEGVVWAPGPWDREPAPATRHARPVAFGHGADPVGRGFASRDGLGGAITGGDVDDDPPTDPHGFPPIPAEPAVAWGAPRAVAPGPVPRALDPAEAAARTLDPAEVAALAGAFAADYLSWDEDDPGRRGRALADHLAPPVGDPALLGWDGRGRQRAELALPGLVRPDGDARVLVDVRVRVTPYRAVGDGGTRPAPQAQPDGPVRSAGLVSPASETADRATDAAETETETEPDVLGVPAAAPAPTGRGWRGCASYWVRLSVPVVREDGRLVVDAAEEAGPDVDDARAHGTGAEVRELRAEPPAADPEPVRLPPAPEPERAW